MWKIRKDSSSGSDSPLEQKALRINMNDEDANSTGVEVPMKQT